MELDQELVKKKRKKIETKSSYLGKKSLTQIPIFGARIQTRFRHGAAQKAWHDGPGWASFRTIRTGMARHEYNVGRASKAQQIQAGLARIYTTNYN